MSREIPPLRLDADTLFGIQPNCLNVHSRFESGLPQAESLISFRRVKRRTASSPLWSIPLLRRLSLPKMLSGANAFEISDIEMNIGAL